MFRWYQNAKKCYVYLSDVEHSTATGDKESSRRWKPAFRKSRWFTRGWTLQELLAPASVAFYSREGEMLGSKESLKDTIHEITDIPRDALSGRPVSEFSVAERFSWAEKRQTTCEEDGAYCLLGIFGVHLPLIYGEGKRYALERLSQTIDDNRRNLLRHRIFKDREQLQYHDLRGSEFRVLVLHPGMQGEELSCHLELKHLSKPPKYQALSYVWGREPPLHPLRIGRSHKTMIRPSLFNALQRMRLHDEPIYLWIDSTCIDQRNEDERNAQVQRMGLIFQRAKNVWIWLGEEDLHTSSAVALITQINRPSFSWEDPAHSQHAFRAFNELLGRSWFRRGWVLQEAAFSANSILFCGSHRLDWKDLTAAVALARKHLTTLISSQDDFDTRSYWNTLLNNVHDSPASRLFDIIKNVFQKREDGETIKQLNLETLVELGTYFETTDPRDAIYALLNLANDTQSSSSEGATQVATPNYRKESLEVLADFILHCCDISGSLDVICRPWAPSRLGEILSLQGFDHAKREHAVRFPSWIIPRDKLPFGDPARNSGHRIHCQSLVEQCQMRVYNAHHNTRPEADVRRCCDGHGDLILRSRGVVIGEIRQLSMRMAGAVITRECLALLSTALNGQEPQLSNPAEAILRVLCADLLSRRTPVISHSKSIRVWDSLKMEIVDDNEEVIDLSSGIDVEDVLKYVLTENIRSYLEIVRDVVWNRRTFCGSKSGSGRTIIGIVPQETKVHDKICILYGCSVPVVLREHRHECVGRCWQLVGECYVDGFMDGEDPFAPSSEVLFDIR